MMNLYNKLPPTYRDCKVKGFKHIIKKTGRSGQIDVTDGSNLFNLLTLLTIHLEEALGPENR